MGAARGTDSERFAEGEIDAASAGEITDAVFERRDAMEGEAGRATPNDDVAAFQAITARAFFAGVTAEQKGGGQAERNGNDGLAEI